MEKAYRHWGHDICDEDTPLEAGLSFTVDWSKTDTLGLAALNQQKERGVSRRLVLFQLLDDQALLTHEEPIWSNGHRVGKVTSSAYGYGLNASLAFGYVEGDLGLTRKDVLNQTYQIEIGNERFDAVPHMRAIYDPDNEEIKN